MKCKINGFLNDFKTYRVILFIFLLNILACSQEEKATSVAIIRFENEFYNSNERSLPCF
jgi:hypothetical protein